MLVNLALGERLDKRTGLASLRAKRTATVQRGSRGSVYTTSLTQSEAMWNAAATTPTLASPILRYYSLLQAGRAVSASSPLPNSQWQAKGGHGLALVVPANLEPKTASFAQILVQTDGSGAAQKLSEALNSPLLNEPASLLDLIAALPQQSLLTERQVLPHRSVSITPNPSMFPNLGPAMRWHDAPPALTAAMTLEPDSSLDLLKDALAPYPSLSNLPRTIGALPVTDAGMPPWIDVEFEPEVDPNDSSFFNGKFLSTSFWKRFIDIWRSPLPLLSFVSGLVLPAVGGNDQPQHPLVTWHLVLYAFSMLARYHSPFWSDLLDYDKNPDAVPLRLLVDQDSQEALQLVELAILGFLADEAALADAPVTGTDGAATGLTSPQS